MHFYVLFFLSGKELSSGTYIWFINTGLRGSNGFYWPDQPNSKEFQRKSMWNELLVNCSCFGGLRF
jgi:hypothetical protein